MKYLNNIIILALSIITLFSCQDNDDLAGSGKTGYLRLTVTNDASTVTRSDVPSDYNAEQIAVQIVSAADSSTVWETDDWSSVEGESIELPVGTYTIVASSYNWDGEASAFDSPYYTGTADITISDGVEVSETVTCTLANVKVTVNYDSELLAAVQATATVVRSENRIYSLNFSSTETRSGYFPVTPLVAEVTVVNEDGESNTLTQELGGDEGVQARDHFILNIKLQETGSSNISVTVDPTTHEYSYTFTVATTTSDISATLNANAWTKFAYLTAEDIKTKEDNVDISSLKFQYREESAETWTDVDATESDGVYTVKLESLTSSTTYKYRLVNGDGITSNTGEFTTEEETVLTNGSFDYWEQVNYVWYPRQSEADDFWDSSNTAVSLANISSTTEETSIVVSGSAAKIESSYLNILGGLVQKFAAGSLYSGKFNGLVGMSGATINFGRPFYSRPIALKGYYRYDPAEIGYIGDDQPEGTVTMGESDICSIYIALASTEYIEGVSANTMFQVDSTDPDTFLDFENDDRFIAYGELPAEECLTTNGSYVEFNIPLKYKEEFFDTEVKQIIIVCSSSKYGDYLTGGDGSVLYVDEFELDYDGEPAIWDLSE